MALPSETFISSSMKCIDALQAETITLQLDLSRSPVRLGSCWRAPTSQLFPIHGSNTPLETRGSLFIDWRAASRAGIAYTLGVFVFAFAAGTFRVMLVAPRLGTLLAVILEAPIVLAVSWQVSLWCTRRFAVSCDPRARVLMGAVAFSVLMLLELGVSALVFGETLDHYFAKYASTPGIVGLVMQGCFATISWVQCRTRDKDGPR
jgi:hypothetical protein